MNERIATLENDNRELRTQLHEAQRGPSVTADDDQNDDGMSHGVATLYRALFEELKFAKQQQWTTTNYLLLVLAAIFGIGKVIEPLTDCEKVIATLLLLTAVGFGYYVLIDLQLYMGRTRKRLDDIQAEDSTFFSPEERKVLNFEKYKPDKHPSLRNLPTWARPHSVPCLLDTQYGGLFRGRHAPLLALLPPRRRCWRYGRGDPCPGVAWRSNLVPKFATSDGDKAKGPALPVAVFWEIPWQ